jgi:hypothetical protein
MYGPLQDPADWYLYYLEFMNGGIFFNLLEEWFGDWIPI